MTARPEPLQVVLPVPEAPPLLAGIPAVVRAARALCEDDGLAVFLRSPARDPIAPWRPLLSGLPVRELGSGRGALSPREGLAPLAPVLVLSPQGVPEPAALSRFAREARAARRPSAWLWHGAPVAVFHPQAIRWLEDAARVGGPELLACPAAPADWHSLTDAAGVSRAEERLYRSLRSESDGYLARLDRRLSIAISRRLVETPVTPNQLTACGLALGLLGASWLASPGYGASVAGALLLCFCCVLDGCDGEVARLKLLSSPFGARFDVAADSVVHLAVFAAIPLHLSRLHPGLDFRAPGLLLASGVLLSMFWVWRLILSRPQAERPGASRTFERLASRDFLYLVAALAAARKLDWFLWSAAVGAHLFWISLVALSPSRRPLAR
ncbi:MAG: CDP-alcohol phosphatidyltransferase family protein [Elusimicrobia bacterium]|nr:CDP-alcohol phosphatidyltransferase family protein [Elusimicrobiota bacterium]